MNTRIVSLLFLALLLSSCSAIRVDHVPPREVGAIDIVVFMDGTANDPGSFTNVAKLHNLTSLQDSRKLRTTYIQGVGSDSGVLGMMTGLGIGDDVRKAYDFLLENFDADQGDRISIFGFSRGAFAARILSALVYVAGIPDTKMLSDDKRDELVKRIYKAYKGEGSLSERREKVKRALQDLPKGWPKVELNDREVYIEFLGLWDTVEALGLPDYAENINEPNTKYADQLCNIRQAAHALSLDDDRARIFTPLPLTRSHLREEVCDRYMVDNKNSIKEVWFSGAHADVGGGYKDSDTNGVSLNWMMDEVREAGLSYIPNHMRVYEDPLGITHDPEGGWFGLIYRKRNRNLSAYIMNDRDGCPSNQEKLEDYGDYNGKEKIDFPCTSTSLSKPLTIHQSVLDRICLAAPDYHESYWFRESVFKNCATCDSSSRGGIKEECSDVLAVEDQNTEAPILHDTCTHEANPDALGKEYAEYQSCNYNHPQIKKWASNRISLTPLTEGARDVLFFPDRKEDRTGVKLLENVSYRFTLIEQKPEFWMDASIPGTPLEGRRMFGGGFVKGMISVLGSSFAHEAFKPFMRVTGELNGVNINLHNLIKSEGVYRARGDGELILKVNEPKGPTMFYANNYGLAVLRIEVVDG